MAASYGLRPVPFIPGLVFALAGLLLSLFFVRDTGGHARHEATLTKASLTTSDPSAAQESKETAATEPSFSQLMWFTSWKDKALFVISQAGLINNLNDGMVWALVPIYLAGVGLPLEQVGLIAAVYPGVWGPGQLVTGAPSDRWGRKWMIATGMWVQAVGILWFVVGQNFWQWFVGATLLGIGTTLVYPTLLAAISDVAHPSWRASAVGVYRLWRDLGFAVGGLTAGLLADALGIPIAIAGIGGLTFISGVIVAGAMYETLPALQTTPASDPHTGHKADPHMKLEV